MFAKKPWPIGRQPPRFRGVEMSRRSRAVCCGSDRARSNLMLGSAILGAAHRLSRDRTVRGPSRYSLDIVLCATRSCTRLNKKSMEQPKNGPPSTVQKHRGEPDTRDRHTNLTNTSKPTPPSDSRARPHPNPGTHASPQTTAHHSPDQARCGGDGHTDAWTHPDLVLLCVNRVNVNTTDATTV
jgi:hypothetical protein